MAEIVIIALDVGHAKMLRSLLQRRVAELDTYLKREGERLDDLEYRLTKDVRGSIAHCHASVVAALDKAGGSA